MRQLVIAGTEVHVRTPHAAATSPPPPPPVRIERPPRRSKARERTTVETRTYRLTI